ncbi:MAG: class I SAM-dependent methyltransferase [Myxococcota bacterium]
MNPLATPDPWNLVADGYTEDVPWMLEPIASRALELAALPRGALVLDVACGPGTLAFLAAKTAAEVQAIDFSPEMIAHLERLRTAREIKNVTAQVGDGQALPFPDARFDAAFSMFGLMFFPDRARGFRELHRTLVPGGKAVVSSWAPASASSFMQVLFSALRAADAAKPEVKPDPLSLENPAVFEREMREAGFAEVTIHRHVQEVPWTSAQSLWARLSRGCAPLMLMKRQLGPKAWGERERRICRHLEETLSKQTAPLDTTALLAVGTRPLV